MWTRERLLMLKHNQRPAVYQPLGLTAKELEEYERLAFYTNLRGPPLVDAWLSRKPPATVYVRSKHPKLHPDGLRGRFMEMYNDAQEWRVFQRDRMERDVELLPSFELWMGADGMEQLNKEELL